MVAKATFLERAIALISPKWAHERECYRNASTQLGEA